MDHDADGWKTLLTRANQLFRATTHPAALLPVEGRLPSLDSATGWLNSPPLTPADLHGHVVLVNFWTYTCINWLRTLAYLRAWADRYQDQGLIVLGVHTPEFEFERDPDNVRRATTDLQVSYPVAIDSNYGIWDAFANHYWPAFYFIDAQGQIRHHRFGEGDYEQSEMILQQLLTEAGSGSGAVGQDLVSVDARGVEAAADWASLGSPENYLGYARTENFASPNGAVLDTPHAYAAPVRLRLYQLLRQPSPVTERTFEITFLDPAPRPTPSPSARRDQIPGRPRRRRPVLRLLHGFPTTPQLGGHHGPGGAGQLHARPNSQDRSEETRRDAAHDAPSSADSPRPSGRRPGPSIPGGVGSRLDSRPERGLAGRLGPAFRG